MVSLLLVCGGEAFAVTSPQQTTTKKTTTGKTQNTTSTGKKSTQTTSAQKTTQSKGTATKATQSKGTTVKTTQSKSSTIKATQSNGATAKKGQGKETATKGNVQTGGTGRNRSKAAKTETSADVKKLQEATHKEIKQTEQQIRENEQKVKSSLNELGKIQDEIGVSKNKISATSTQINTLTGRISGLEKGISDNEKELQRLRDEYLKAVKKMRLARGGNSALSFIFSSDNFSQALRRMRYLRQFSEWKERQSGVIDSTTVKLRSQREDLSKIKREQSEVLKQQQKDQALLQEQYTKQDAIVAGLRQNGTALKSHLSKKQAEANQLNIRIANLIAEEQRRAEEARLAEERRKAEEARKAAAEKARKEAEEKARKEAEEKARREAEEARKAEERRLAEAKAAAEKAAAEHAAAEKAAKEKQMADKAANEKAAQAKAAAEKAAAKKAELERKAKENAAKEIAAKEKAAKEKAEKEKDQATAKSFANARKRTPRADGQVAPAATKVEKSSNTAAGSKSVAKSSGKQGGDFAAMKGSLPRPVAGAFRVKSRFGRQSLPDLPDIVYDNPGIDAEVASGAAAAAVFGGKVSGVYMIPGYNTVVIVNHGSYYTVYGNISSPSVKVGDSVSTGQKLGVLAPDEDSQGHSSIHFEVWRNREKLNPLEWIR